ncbi:MAG TPA: DNA mismatch repair protein MutS [Mycobacteriales bacterium]|nr:DNA mismatch repair protein MutS [Mycobacteriales bacterium]
MTTRAESTRDVAHRAVAGSGRRGPYRSLLFLDGADGRAVDAAAAPACFVDLNLDQVVAAVIGEADDYRLRPLFHIQVDTVEEIRYRHAVFADLDGTPLARRVAVFAERMRGSRESLQQAAKLRNPHQKQRWLLEAAAGYAAAVADLSADLARAPLDSAGLAGFRDYVSGYADSTGFRTLQADAGRVADGLAAARYCLGLSANLIQVRRYDSEADYGAEVEQSFLRFRQHDAADHQHRFTDWPEVNHVEAEILSRVARLFPAEFADLESFRSAHRDYLDPVVGAFDREVQFYLHYLALMARLRAAGLPLCYPEVSADSKRTEAVDTYDLALAVKTVAERVPLVRNDVSLSGRERIVVVTGPNQGGKTTFARLFGQLHVLARLGCPVPGQHARLFVCDAVYTHFERGENLTDLRGKLEDDLVRVRDILAEATPRSVVVLNEIFTSTTFRDAVLLGRAVLAELSTLDALAVCVTFVDELACFDDKTVSLVAAVAPEDPAVRTFKLERRPADGRAYATVLAAKHGLTYRQVRDRLRR